MELAQPYLIKVAIDDYILTADWAGLAVVAVLYAASLGALYALRMVEAYLMALTGQQVIHDLRATLFAPPAASWRPASSIARRSAA